MISIVDMGKIPQIQWKGQTFNQITSKIKRNLNTGTSRDNFFRAQPLTIYRRELYTNDSTNCNVRISSSIDIFDRPNGTTVNSTANNMSNVLDNTLDIIVTENKSENYHCNTKDNCFNPASNALRKLRSGGMIKRQFDISKNNDTYATSTNQYLVSRNRSFQQNQYNYIRQGSALVKPGDALSVQNVYSANGINHCQKYHIATDTSFQYQWINGDYVTVDIPSGFYALEDINSKLQFAMSANSHYFVNKTTKSPEYLINLAFNTFTNSVELQIKNTSESIFPSGNYNMPIDPNSRIGETIKTWTNPLGGSIYPVVIINNTIFKDIIGFSPGRYPNYETRKGTTVFNETIFFYQVDLELTLLVNTALFKTVEVDNAGIITRGQLKELTIPNPFITQLPGGGSISSDISTSQKNELLNFPSISLSKFLTLNVLSAADANLTLLINTALFNDNKSPGNNNITQAQLTDILNLTTFTYGSTPYTLKVISQTEKDAFLNSLTLSLSDFLSSGAIIYRLIFPNFKLYISTSLNKPKIQPLYVPIYYKPNNPNFAQQGGVSCSTSILKTKYDAVTKNASIFTKAYGIAVSNELAYGVPSGGYTVKDKIGFPIKSTPKFSAVNGSLMVCQSRKSYNG